VMTPPTPQDERTTTQRRADAMGELARRLLEQGGLPVVQGQRPQLGVRRTKMEDTFHVRKIAAETPNADSIPARVPAPQAFCGMSCKALDAYEWLCIILSFTCCIFRFITNTVRSPT